MDLLNSLEKMALEAVAIELVTKSVDDALSTLFDSVELAQPAGIAEQQATPGASVAEPSSPAALSSPSQPSPLSLWSNNDSDAAMADMAALATHLAARLARYLLFLRAATSWRTEARLPKGTTGYQWVSSFEAVEDPARIEEAKAILDRFVRSGAELEVSNLPTSILQPLRTAREMTLPMFDEAIAEVHAMHRRDTCRRFQATRALEAARALGTSEAHLLARRALLTATAAVIGAPRTPCTAAAAGSRAAGGSGAGGSSGASSGGADGSGADG